MPRATTTRSSVSKSPARRTTTRTPKKQPLTLGDLGKMLVNYTVSLELGRFLVLLLAVFIALMVGSFGFGYYYAKSQGTSVATNTGATGQPAQAEQPKVSIEKVKDAFKKSKLKFGDVNKKLVVIEVADPSCPYCHIAGGHNPDLNKQSGAQFTLVSDGGSYVAPVTEIKKLLDDGKIAFSYIYYPGHANGDMATKALYCAYDQDKFWEAHDLLMSGDGYNLINNTVKNDPSQSQALVDLVGGVLDGAALKSCIDSGKYDKQLKDDQALATELQVQGTPGFYLNDTMYPGAYSFTDMEKTIKEAGI